MTPLFYYGRSPTNTDIDWIKACMREIPESFHKKVVRSYVKLFIVHKGSGRRMANTYLLGCAKFFKHRSMVELNISKQRRLSK
jgi:hypothetical protein